MKQLCILLLVVFLIGGCGVTNKFFKNQSENELSEYGIAKDDEYDNAIKNKQLIEGMSSKKVEELFGSPIYKKKKTDDIIIWEYPKQSLYFLQDLLVVWKDK